MSYNEISFKNLKTLPSILMQDWSRRTMSLEGKMIPNQKGIYIISMNLKNVDNLSTNFKKMSNFIPLYIGRGQLRERFNNHKIKKKEFFGMHQYLEFWYLVLYKDLKNIDEEGLKNLEAELINSFYPVVNKNDEISNKTLKNTYTEEGSIYSENIQLN